MAITTYNELQSAIAAWLDRADLSVRLPEFIALAEAQMNRELRVRQMVTRSTANVSSAFVELPPNYLEAKAASATDAIKRWPLQATPPEVAEEWAADGRTGPPKVYAVVGDELRLHPAPDRDYAIELTFYARIPALSNVTPSNWVLAEAPDAYLYGGLLQAAPYLRDAEGASQWAASYAVALNGLRAGDRTMAGRLRMEASFPQSSSYSIRTDI